MKFILIAEVGTERNFWRSHIIRYEVILQVKSACCGVGGRALASYTECRGFEPQCGGRLSSLTC